MLGYTSTPHDGRHLSSECPDRVARPVMGSSTRPRNVHLAQVEWQEQEAVIDTQPSHRSPEPARWIGSTGRGQQPPRGSRSPRCARRCAAGSPPPTAPVGHSRRPTSGAGRSTMRSASINRQRAGHWIEQRAVLDRPAKFGDDLRRVSLLLSPRPRLEQFIQHGHR